MAKKDKEGKVDIKVAILLELKEKKDALTSLHREGPRELQALVDRQNDEERKLMAARANAIKPYETEKQKKISSAKSHYQSEDSQADARYAEVIKTATEFRDTAQVKSKVFFKEACASSAEKFQREAEKLLKVYKKDVDALKRKNKEAREIAIEVQLQNVAKIIAEIDQIETDLADLKREEKAA